MLPSWSSQWHCTLPLWERWGGGNQRDKLQLGKKTNTGQPGTEDRAIQVACKKKKKVPTPFLLICGSKASSGSREERHKELNQRKQDICTPLLASPSPSHAGCYIPSPYTEQQLTPQVLLMRCKQQHLHQVLQIQTFLSGACIFTEHLKTSTFMWDNSHHTVKSVICFVLILEANHTPVVQWRGHSQFRTCKK